MGTVTYTPIASQTLTSSAASVTFSSIPQDYRDLVVVTNGRGTTTSYTVMAVAFNGSSTGYEFVAMYGDGSATASYTESATVISANQIARSNSTSGYFTPVIFNIMDYSATDKHKSVLLRNSGTGTNMIVLAGAGRWANTSAITSMTFYPGNGNFETGSTFELFGIAA